MNANELRIGNLVTISHKAVPELNGHPIKVVGVYQNDIMGRKVGYTHSVLFEQNYYKDEYKNGEYPHTAFIKYIKPIPLTAEMLSELGFHFDFELNHEKVFSYNPDGRRIFSAVFCSKIDNTTTFKGRPIHLHDLQNIHFALTGTELDVSSLYKKTD